MSISPSTSKWKPIDGSFESLAGTTEVVDLPRKQWPTWAWQSTQLNRIGVYALPAGSLPGVTLRTTGVVRALLTERIDPKDSPKVYNYNLYTVAETTDGKLFQSPPMIPADLQHHSSSPSTWLNSLGHPTAA